MQVLLVFLLVFLLWEADVFIFPPLGRFAVHAMMKEKLLDRGLREAATNNYINHLREKIIKKLHLSAGWRNN